MAVEGFNFRSNLAFVSDPADTQFVGPATAYPTTANGVTFGWEALPNGGVDRVNTVDARLAGFAYRTNVDGGTQAVFRVDLPATGDYEVSLAIGDVNLQRSSHVVDLVDGTTVFATLIGPNVDFMDASGNQHLTADWAANQVPLARTFTTQIFRMRLGKIVAPVQDNTCVAHVSLEPMTPATPIYAQTKFQLFNDDGAGLGPPP